jgi:predicted RecA/RadA family phage recombinase
MKTLLSSGDTYQFTSSGTVTAGTGVLVGQLLVIPETTAVDAIYTGRIRGVVTIAKVGSLAVSVGDALYWNDSTKVVNKTPGKEVGIAMSATGSGAGETSLDMLLVPTIRASTSA